MIPTPLTQKINAFVEEEWKKLPPHKSPETTEAFHRAITFGLELAKEAGPEKAKVLDREGYDLDNATLLHFERWGFNAALTSKNTAIQEIIDGMKV